MQIAALRDNIHEITKPIFKAKQETYHRFVFYWISPESGKG